MFEIKMPDFKKYEPETLSFDKIDSRLLMIREQLKKYVDSLTEEQKQRLLEK